MSTSHRDLELRICELESRQATTERSLESLWALFLLGVKAMAADAGDTSAAASFDAAMAALGHRCPSAPPHLHLVAPDAKGEGA